MTQTSEDVGSKRMPPRVDTGTSTSTEIGQLSVNGLGLLVNCSLAAQPTALASLELGTAEEVEQKPTKDKSKW